MNNSEAQVVEVDQINYEVKMKVEGDLLHYFITGERDFRSSYLMWKRIYRDCAEYGVNKVRATVLLNGVLDRMEIPLLIHKLIELNNSKPITCAWVDHNAHSFQDNLVGERIPRPKSMNIQIFNNEEDAENWLAQF